MKASGGYVIHRAALVRKGLHVHTSALERPVSDFDVASLNAVQATPWRINQRVYDTMVEAWNSDVLAAGLMKATMRLLPDKLPTDVWERMLKEDQLVHLKMRSEIHAFNASATGRQFAIVDCLSVASELRDERVFYYPHSRCFRGRIHPIPASGPNPQGNDVSKALLEFGHGMALGPDGLYWLLVRFANNCGQDKLPLDERMAWALDQMPLIQQTAVEPLGSPWWYAMDNQGGGVLDEPWQALATLLELADAMSHPGGPEAFVSHLPVALDGACNGIQHLSAMGLDPVGARATNLCSGVPRQDVYAEVAVAVNAMVNRDAAEGSLKAMAWVGQVGRKTVKRAVMTTPYGVTSGGIRLQLIEDGMVPEGEDQGGKAAYLRDCLVVALSETVVSAKEIMLWLQVTALRLAEAGLPFEFRTPTGSLVRQAYHTVYRNRVMTLCGRLQSDEEATDGVLNPKKCALAAAPNTIHAFDATHLSMTVNAAVACGVVDFAMIHDSYGTHAANTTRLSAVLREAFITLYSVDRLQEIADYIGEYAPHVQLEPVPPRKTFDLTQVADAPFFFS